VIQHLQAPGVDGILRQSIFLPDHEDYIEVESVWEMGLTTHPEATYLPFHLNLVEPTVHLDLGGQGMQPGVDQLPGSCADYYTVQRWVDFSDGQKGLLIATPDTPMMMFGDFHIAEELPTFRLDQPLLLAWVTNNYWMTNFRAHQPGQVRARFRLLPYAGAYDEVRAHRMASEAAIADPIVQGLGEAAAEPQLPPTGSFLMLPGSDSGGFVLTLHVKRSEKGNDLIARLYNPTEQEQPALVSSGLLRIHSAAICDIFENPLQQVTAEDGQVRINLPSRQMVVLRMIVSAA